MAPRACQNPTTPNPSLFDVHEIHEGAISVAPSSSSPDSSPSISTGSPMSLNPGHDVHSSLGSTHGTLTVKFAPLPQIDPNRKRSLAPVGVPARSRHRRVIHQDGDSLLWSTDPDVPENMEDPIITFAKFVKKTSQMLWRRMRKGSKTTPPVTESYYAEPILDITGKPTACSGGVAPGEKDECVSKVVDGEVKRRRPSSWSPSSERRTLSLQAKRRNTSDLSVP